MAEGQAPPRFIGCEMGDGNTADLVLVNLYTGDSHIVCMLHGIELMDAAAHALFSPDDPTVAAAVAAAGDMTQAEVKGSVSATRARSLTEREDPDEFDFDGVDES